MLNQGIVWDPVTGAGDRYTKRHPVPFGEYIPLRWLLRQPHLGRLDQIARDMLRGTRVEPLDVAGRAGRRRDLLRRRLRRRALRPASHGGAELLVVQTSNATFIHTDQIDQQFAITPAAGDRDRPLASWSPRPTASPGVIAPDGTVVATAEPRTQAVLVEQVGLDDAVTPAVRIGPWLGRRASALVGRSALVLASGPVSSEPPIRQPAGTPATTGRRARDAAAPRA